MKFSISQIVLLASSAAANPAVYGYPDGSDSLQAILRNTHHSKLYTYPTDLTRGIVPKPFHSHNDYWRDVPFYSALSYGAISVEADVWLYNETLHVGHEESALTDARTFESLYVNPILDVLHRQNPSSKFLTSGPTHNGVYDTSSGQTLYLFVDVKTDGPTTWPYVLEALKPLAQGGWLSNATGSGSDAAVTNGAVTVIGTGNTPLQYFHDHPGTEAAPRNVFYDAHLPLLSSAEANITKAVSPIASTDFAAQFGQVVNSTLTPAQLELLHAQIAVAKGKGIGARYWDQPGFPAGTRNALWRILIDAGVALINVDDLAGAAGFWEME